jgi:hypothetical protein
MAVSEERLAEIEADGTRDAALPDLLVSHRPCERSSSPESADEAIGVGGRFEPVEAARRSHLPGAPEYIPLTGRTDGPGRARLCVIRVGVSRPKHDSPTSITHIRARIP